MRPASLAPQPEVVSALPPPRWCVWQPAWKYTLRMREGLYGAWRKLNEHRAGKCPYLHDLGSVVRGEFVPSGPLDYRVSYGAICELVQLEAKRQEVPCPQPLPHPPCTTGHPPASQPPVRLPTALLMRGVPRQGINHRVYKQVAEDLVRLSPNPRSVVPLDLHMTIREIYKTCYPGFGAGTGSGAYAPGLQAGGSSTKSSTSGSMLGKGIATMTKRVQDEDMRKRLDTRHEFLNLISH
jgi:hypothetical protein